MSDEVRTERDDVRHSYVITVDGEQAGYAHFVQEDGRITFDHTHVDPAFGGRGLGGTLVEAALTDAAAKGSTIIPVCTFVQGWLRKHDVPGAVIEWPADAAEESA